MSVFRGIYDVCVTVASIANAVGTAVIFLLVAVMNIDVIARGVFSAPLRGVVEVVIFSMVLIVFLQLPDVVRHNRLTRSDGFLVFSRSIFPRFSASLTRGIDAVAAMFMALIAWTVWPEFSHSIASCSFFTAPEFGTPPTGAFWVDLKAAFGRCEYFGTPGIFTAPWWPAKLAIAFSVSLCAVIFAFKAVMGDREPALIKDGESPA
ncbi:TRAP transporter small permease [Rhizobiaceae bacterium]|nr:TRAP transporter small permease [Rhizobiaceae bacterium]